MLRGVIRGVYLDSYTSICCAKEDNGFMAMAEAKDDKHTLFGLGRCLRTPTVLMKSSNILSAPAKYEIMTWS